MTGACRLRESCAALPVDCNKGGTAPSRSGHGPARWLAQLCSSHRWPPLPAPAWSGSMRLVQAPTNSCKLHAPRALS